LGHKAVVVYTCQWSFKAVVVYTCQWSFKAAVSQAQHGRVKPEWLPIKQDALKPSSENLPTVMFASHP